MLWSHTAIYQVECAPVPRSWAPGNRGSVHQLGDLVQIEECLAARLRRPADAGDGLNRKIAVQQRKVGNQKSI